MTDLELAADWIKYWDDDSSLEVLRISRALIALHTEVKRAVEANYLTAALTALFATMNGPSEQPAALGVLSPEPFPDRVTIPSYALAYLEESEEGPQ